MKDIYEDLPNKYIYMVLTEIWRHGGIKEYVPTARVARGIGSRIARDGYGAITCGELLACLNDDHYLKREKTTPKTPTRGRPAIRYKLTTKAFNFIEKYSTHIQKKQNS